MKATNQTKTAELVVNELSRTPLLSLFISYFRFAKISSNLPLGQFRRYRQIRSFLGTLLRS